MSVTVIGVDQLEGSGESSGDRTQRVAYKSFANAPFPSISEGDVSTAVINFSGIDIGSPWPNDATSLCRKIRSEQVRRIDSVPPRWEWRSILEFSSVASKDDPQQPTKEKDPTLRPPTITIAVQRFESAATKDKNGNPVTNSANDPVVRSKARSRLVVRWQRYMRQFDWENAEEAKGEDLNIAANSFWPLEIVNPRGFMLSRNYFSWSPTGIYQNLMGTTRVARGGARIEDMRLEFVNDFGGCVLVGVEVHIDETYRFQDVFLDQGFTRLATPGVEPDPNPFAPITSYDHNGDPTPNPPLVAVAPDPLTNVRFTSRDGWSAQPRLLDGAGNELDPGLEPKERAYQHYYFRDWNKLGGEPGFFS
jgi:hypothetical protein